MKNILLMIAFIASLSLSAQQTYYWVGGSGNWSNLDKWATASGGTERFGVLPTASDDVIFDENSFVGDGNRVSIDVDAEMNDLTAINLSFDFIVLDDDGGKLTISGNVNLDPNLRIQSTMYFSSANTSLFQNNGGDHSISLYMDGGGTLILQDSVAFGFTDLRNASTIDFNGQSVAFDSFFWVYDATLMSVESAKIYLTGNRFNTQTSSIINLPTSTIYGSSSRTLSFFGGGHSYHHLVMPNATIRNNNTIEKLTSNNGELVITNENAIDSLIINNSRLELSDNTTNTVGFLELKGSRGDFSEIIGGANQSTLDISEEPNLIYSSFENINIAAAEAPVATNSLDLGNNSGFTINAITPLDYYWIGGSGDLSDLTHWATTSGGSELHEELYSTIDNLVFDQNSTSGNALITASEEISINNFQMTGVTDSITFDLNDVNIYGVLFISETTSSDSFRAQFRGAIVGGHNLGNYEQMNYNLRFYEGEHYLSGDSIKTSIILNDGGHLHLSDKYIETEQLYNLSGRAEFQNSTIKIDWRIIGNNIEDGSDFTNSQVFLADNENKFSTRPRIDISGDTLSYAELGNEVQLFDSNFDTLVIPSGNTVDVFESIRVATAMMNGEDDNFIKLIGNNGAKIISREGEDIDASKIEITNLPAEAATFTADNSIDRGGNTGWTFTNEIEIPAVPTGLSVSNITASTYRASWDEVPGATSYIFSSTPNGANPAGTNPIEVTDNFYEGNAGQYWWVAAKNALGTSDYTERQRVTFVPLKPSVTLNFAQAISASINYSYSSIASSTAYIDLSTDEEFTSYVEGYQNVEIVLEGSEDNQDFIFESLDDGTEYFCRVRVANESGTSENSETLSFNTTEKLTQSIAFAAISDKTVLDEPFDLVVSATSGLEVAVVSSDAEVASVVGKTVTIHSLGEVTFTASQDGNDGFSPAEPVSRTLVITKADQSITFTALEAKTFGDAPFDLTASGGASGNTVTYNSSDENVATVSESTVTIVGAGTTSITASQQGNEDFFEADPITIEFTVGKAALIATADNKTTTFGGELPTYTVSLSGFVGMDDEDDLSELPMANSTATKTSDAGDYDITVSGGSDENYGFTYVSGTLTIAKAEQAITFNDIADIDITNTSTVTLEATSSSGLSPSFSLVDGDGSISGNILTVNTPGNFTLTASQAGNVNYNAATSVSQSFVVNDSRKQDQTITFSSLANATYGDASISLSATSTSGLDVTYSIVSGDDASISGNILTVLGAGTVEIEARQDGNDGFNAATPVVQSLVIDAARVTITPDDKEIILGDALPTFTITYSGFVNGEDESALAMLPVVSSPTADIATEGEYDILVTQDAIAVNYVFTNETGTLRVVRPLSVLNDEQLVFYPNPVVDVLSILGLLESVAYEIISLDGKVVDAGNTTEQINLSDIKKGTYVLQLKDANQHVIRREVLIKK